MNDEKLTKPSRLLLAETIDMVATFHTAFGIANAPEPTVAIEPSLVALRHRLMAEENDEYLAAAESGNLVEVADALGDMLYILCGTILSHGLQHKIEDVFAEIQRSNMSKLGPDGKAIYRADGKVMKGPDYTRPNVAAALGL